MDEKTVTLELTKTVKKSVSNIPAKDIDQRDLGLSVSAAWKINPHVTLLWITQAEFEQKVKAFDTTLTQRITTGGGRTAISKELETLDKTIDKNVEYLKGYLKEKYGKDNAPSYYPQFGLEKVGKSIMFPRDRNKRSEALGQTLLALESNGIGTEKYGTASWQPIKERYDVLLTSAKQTDGSVSEKVGTKNQLRESIILTQNALIHILRGNYPKDYKNVIRTWGFQKEKY